MDIDKKNGSNSHEIEKLKTQIVSLKKINFGLVWEEKGRRSFFFKREHTHLRDNLKMRFIKTL